jgi:hypothetical protein
MNAGLPGIGLSGLFALLSGLFLPISVMVRRASRNGRPKVRALIAMTLVVVLLDVMLWYFVAKLLGATGSGHWHIRIGHFSVPTMLITLLVLTVGVLFIEVCAGLLPTKVPPVVPLPDPIWLVEEDAAAHPDPETHAVQAFLEIRLVDDAEKLSSAPVA